MTAAARQRAACSVFSLVLAAVLVLFPLFRTAGQPAAPAPARYVCFYLGRPFCSGPSGELEDCPASLVREGTALIPLEAAVSALEGEKKDGKTEIGGTAADPSLLDADGDGLVPLTSFCEAFGLGFRNYGDMVQIGTSVPLLDSERRSALRQAAGCAEQDAVASAEALPEDVIDPYVKITYDVLLEDVAALEKAYPDLISTFTVGTTLEGREIPAFTFGRGERVIFYGASIHASEYVTTNFILEMVDRYAAGYYADRAEDGFLSYRELLDSVTFYVIPEINPDGVNIVQNGARACTVNIKKYDKQGATGVYQYKANANGVDLNRNFPYKWTPELYNRIDHRCWRYFCGFEANSEPEVRAMVTMAANIPFEMFADFHKFGEEFFWVDSDSEDHIGRYGTIAERLARETGFALHEVEDISDFGGSCSNYMRNVYDRFSMTVEICEFWNYNPPHFNKINRTAWKIGLIMGEELLGMEDTVPGLRVCVNGRTVPCWEDCLPSDGALSAYQARKLVEACGGTLEAGENGLRAVIGGKEVSCGWKDAGSLDPGNVLVVWEEGMAADLTGLLSRTRTGVFLEGKTVYAFCWS